MSAQPQRQPIRIVRAEFEHLEQAGQVLARAFADEDSTGFLLDLSGPKARAWFADAMTLSLLHFYGQGYRTLVATDGNAVVGVGVLRRKTPHRRVPLRRRLRAALKQLPGLLKLATRLRWRNLPAIGRAVRTPAALRRGNDFLEWLAVAPEYQGQGIGRRLLAALRQAEGAAGSRGIYTYTVGEANLAFYRRCGYCAHARVEANPNFVVYHIVLAGDRSGA